MADFLARLHPLIVHLPIGIVLLAILMSWRRQQAPPDGARLLWSAAAGAALLAAATGWLLLEGDTALDVLTNRHRWLGWSMTALTLVIAAIQYSHRQRRLPTRLLTLPLLALLALTTHFGTSLIHGADYLKAGEMPADKNPSGMVATDIPAEQVRPPDANAIRALEAAGMLVLPVAEGSPYLSVNGVNAPDFGDREAALLAPLADQIVWLKLSGTAVGDSAMVHIGRLSKVSRLYIDQTRVGDAGLTALAAMPRLRWLNLSGLHISADGLVPLKDLPALETVYLYGCGLPPETFTTLQKKFSRASLDTGGYQLPILPGDTSRLQAPGYSF